MSIPISETGLFQQNATQWSGNQTIDNSATEPILNELNWSANPNTYINGQRPQSFWSPADGSKLEPVIWNDFVVISATANFSNNGNSASTLNMKLVPNKTFFERAKTTKHYNSLYDTVNGTVGHDKNIYDSDKLQPKVNDYTYIPNVGYVQESTYGVYRGNTFSNFNYKNLSTSNPRYDANSFTRQDFKSIRNPSSDPNLIYSDDSPSSILSPDGLPLFLKPWYTRIGEPTNVTIKKFNFGGIISSWKITKGMDGFFYECVITDPSEILKGVNVIVSNYKGPSGYFNVINALGYFEAMNGGIPYNANYGYTRFPKVDRANTSGTDVYFEPENNFNYNLNDTVVGMRISHIASSLAALLRAPALNTTNPNTYLFDLQNQNGQVQTPRIYGGPIVFGHRETMNWYNVDLSVFNLVQENYFVEGSGGVISLYDLFSMICKDAGYDMIVTLSGNNIVPKFINRNFAPNDNVIAQAIQSLSSKGNSVSDASYGYELIEQNTTGQLLIGSPKEVFYQTSAIRPVYGSYRGNPILGIPGAIKITLPSLIEFDAVGLGEPPQLGEIGTITVKKTREIEVDVFDPVTGEKTGTETKREVYDSAKRKIGFNSKIFSVEFVKIPLPTQLIPFFGDVYVTNTMEMMLVKSEKGAVVWEKFLRFSKPDIWQFLYGYNDEDDTSPQMPKDHSQTGSSSVDSIYQEKLGYNTTLSKDEIANRLFQTISSYAESWGKYWAVSLPDKASTIGTANEYNMSSSYKSMNLDAESYYNGSKGPSLGQRKLHYAVKEETYIDVNPSWMDSSFANNSVRRSTVVDSSNFPIGNDVAYPMDMQPETLGQFLNSNQNIGPVAEYSNLLLKLSNKTLSVSQDESFDKDAFGDEFQTKTLVGNYLGYSGNDFLNGIYPNPANDSLVAKGTLSDQLTFMNPDFTTELDNIEALNSIITLRPPQVKFGVGYEETFYTSDQMSGAYNDIVFTTIEGIDPISTKLAAIVNKGTAADDLDNPDLEEELPLDIQATITRIYNQFWRNKKQTYCVQGKPYIYGYFTVVEMPNYPIYGMSKKAEMQEFMMYLEGLDAGNVTSEDMASMATENVFPFRVKGPPIYPSRIGVPLSLTFDNWVFRDDPDAYGKDSRSKYPYIGKVDVQIDESLNPSSYGGFTYFFAAAQAKIKAISPQRQNESGSITFAGFPSGTLGDCLAIDGNLSSEIAANGGPALTGINISFDYNKISTTYEFKNFAPRFGVTSREYIDRIKNAGNQAQKARMLAFKQFIDRSYSASSTKAQPQYVSRYHDRQPPHEIIYFRQFNLPKHKAKRIVAKSGTEQECLRDMKPKLDGVALASWDAFLAPYSLRSLSLGSLEYAYGIEAKQNSMILESGTFKESSSKLDNWAGFKNPTVNAIKQMDYIKNLNKISNQEKEGIAVVDYMIKKYKNYLTLLDGSGLKPSEQLDFVFLNGYLFGNGSIDASVNSMLLNPIPKESNIDTILYKKNKDTVTNIRGHKGKFAAKYATAIGLKGPLVVTGWGIDKHKTNTMTGSGGPLYNFVGTGGLLPLTGTNTSIGDQSNFLTGPVDLLWDSYRKTWSTKDTELVYVKSYEKAPSGFFGYFANCIPLHFVDDFNATGSLRHYPIVASGLTNSKGWEDNLKIITAGTGNTFKAFYSIKPQTGSIYTATFINNSVHELGLQSTTTSGYYVPNVGTVQIPISSSYSYAACPWVLNPEDSIVGVYSSGSIYDMFNRRFDENIDFIHPVDFTPNNVSSLKITKFKLENNIVTLTYSGGPNPFAVGDKIKISFTPASTSFDGIFVITSMTSTTISYKFIGDNLAEASSNGSITEPENVSDIRKKLLTKAKEGNYVLLKVFPAGKATYTIMKGSGSGDGGPVCNVECVGNILTVTYC